MTFCIFQNDTIDSDQSDDGGKGVLPQHFQNIDKQNKKIYTKNLGTPILCNKRHRKQTFHTSQNIFKKLLLSNIDYSDIFLELH